MKGTQYQKGNLIAICQEGYHHKIVFAKICMILFHEEKNLYALLEIIKTKFIPYLKCYKLGDTKGFECLFV